MFYLRGWGPSGSVAIHFSGFSPRNAVANVGVWDRRTIFVTLPIVQAWTVTGIVTWLPLRAGMGPSRPRAAALCPTARWVRQNQARSPSRRPRPELNTATTARCRIRGQVRHGWQPERHIQDLVFRAVLLPLFSIKGNIRRFIHGIVCRVVTRNVRSTGRHRWPAAKILLSGD